MDTQALRRANIVASHLECEASHQLMANQTSGLGTPGRKSPDDIVIVKAVRTPIGKARRGSFRDTTPDNLLVPVLKHLRETTPELKPEQVGDIVIGTVLPRSGQGATEVRIASLLSGFPEEVPCTTVNRQCSSGLQAIANVASAITAGLYEVGIAGGVESMSTNSMGWDGAVNQEALKHPKAAGCYMSMGQTSENVAERYNISRTEQDQMAVDSHRKAIEAIKTGRFSQEIVPVTTSITDPSTGKPTTITVTQDEGTRAGTTLQKLSKLRPAFKQGGTTTAGNSSQLSDGAAACIICSRATAERMGVPVLGVLRSFAAVGVEPSVMGIGPAVAIPAAVKQAGLNLNDIDVFEINEAFGSQATYCVKKLGIPMEKVNPNGGAIALGHPLGCTGARMTATLLHELKRRKGRYGIVSMCIGTGMGAAAVYEHES